MAQRFLTGPIDDGVGRSRSYLRRPAEGLGGPSSQPGVMVARALQVWLSYKPLARKGSTMTPRDIRQRVECCADTVSLELYEGVAVGVASASTMLQALPHHLDYPHLLPLSARAFMREHWLANGLPDGWEIAGNPRLMGQTLLRNETDGVEMRLLKERRRAYPGGVPVAGSNQSRRKRWRQAALGFDIPGRPFADETVRLLALWDHAKTDDGKAVLLRVVHTLEPGVYGSRVPVDLSYEIKPAGGIFETLQFRGESQEEDLFAEIDREENEVGSTGS